MNQTNAVQHFFQQNVFETLLEWHNRETWGNALAFLRFDTFNPTEMLDRAAVVWAKSSRNVGARELFKGRLVA